MDYCHQFLRKIKAIKSYLVKLDEDSSMKSKVYLDNYSIGSSNCHFIIFITNDKSMFNANNDCQ